MTCLLHLNGLPGVGKSTLADRLGSAGWYVVDPDRLRATGLDARAARDRAWADAAAALAAGHDVVVAQLVARPGELDRLAGLASSAGARFVPVLLVDPTGALTAAAVAGDHPLRAELRGADGEDRLAAYTAGLATLPGVRRLDVVPGDPDATYAALLALLD